MFRAGLSRQNHQFFGAVTVGIDIRDQLQPLVLEMTETHIRNFNLRGFGFGEYNAGGAKHLKRSLSVIADLFSVHSEIPLCAWPLKGALPANASSGEDGEALRSFKAFNSFAT